MCLEHSAFSTVPPEPAAQTARLRAMQDRASVLRARIPLTLLLLTLVLVGWTACNTASRPDAASLEDAGVPSDSGLHDGDLEGGLPFDGGGPSLEPLTFGPCPERLWSRASIECANLTVPLHWGAPDGRELTIMVARAPARVGPARAELWHLTGGPGPSSIEMGMTIIENVQDAVDDVDVMLLDYRGIGYSHRLGCPIAESPESPGGVFVDLGELWACGQSVSDEWGADIRGFSIEASMRDLLHTMDRTAATFGPRQVIVQGTSYGTYAALRLLQLAPSRLDGVILDSTCVPGRCSFPLGMSRGYDEAGAELFADCAADATCNEWLEGDPAGYARRALDALEDGACPAASELGLDRRGMQSFAAYLFESAKHLLPSFYRRLSRCGAEDQGLFELVSSLYAPVAYDPPTTTELPLSSTAAAMVLTRSEQWDLEGIDEEEAERQLDELTFVFHVPAEVSRAYADAPRYDPGPLATQWPDTDVPLLILQGTYDTRTPVSATRALAERYTGAHQHYVEMPRYEHSIIQWYPGSDGSFDGPGFCGWHLAMEFLRDSRGALDVSCRDELGPPDFESSEGSRNHLGSPTPY